MQHMTMRFTEELKQLAFEHHDSCINCGHNFIYGDTTHLGYDNEGKPLYVCDTCSIKLSETAIRHFFSPRAYVIPEKSRVLWRYLDFTKYVSLLSTKCLYFSRADCFNDSFEGAKGLKKRKARWDKFYLDFFREAIRDLPEEAAQSRSEQEIDVQARRLLLELEQAGVSSRIRTYINCWHENEQESEAMWRLYSSYIENAIAIKSTYGRLYEALGKRPDIDIGRVKYVDFDTKFSGPNDAYWHKRESFSHEREVRAIIRDHDCHEKGILVHCDLTMLIEAVIISPSAPSWFTDLVVDVNSKYQFNFNVSSSVLSEEPFF